MPPYKNNIIRYLTVVTHKENTSSLWSRENQVLKQNPDLIVIHRSCFYDATNLTDENFFEELYRLADSKLISFFAKFIETIYNLGFFSIEI